MRRRGKSDKERGKRNTINVKSVSEHINKCWMSSAERFRTFILFLVLSDAVRRLRIIVSITT
jgi:hypothetical protein